MQFFDLSLFKFSFFDILDVLLVALLIYQLYSLIRGTIAANIFIGLAIIFGLYYVVKALHMQLLTGILGKFVDVGIIALIVVFQQDAGVAYYVGMGIGGFCFIVAAVVAYCAK